MRNASWALFVVAAVLAVEARAQGQIFSCGPLCGDPGHRVLCNDGLPDTGQMNLDCSASLGSCTGERFCATLRPPADSYPAYLTAVWIVTGPLAVGGQFDLEVYQESGSASPGAQIAPLVPNSYQIGGDPSRWTLIDLTSAGDQYKITSGAFRVCLRKQFDQSHNVCMDSDGITPQSNWMFADVALDAQDPCNTQLGFLGWYASSDFGLQGDFAIRAEMVGTDRADWQAGGFCAPTSVDAGPAADAGAARDAGSDDDAGSPSDADGGDGDGDAGDDVGGEDAGDAEADAGGAGGEDAGGAPAAPPVITSITPDQGRSDQPTSVIVLGSGFQPGLTLQVASIPATDVVVSGSSTIDAVVPANIAPGTYDLLVRNPDQQVAILQDAFTVLDPRDLEGGDGGTGGVGDPDDDGGVPGGGVGVPGGCACGASSPGSSPALAAAAALSVCILLRRRRRRAD